MLTFHVQVRDVFTNWDTFRSAEGFPVELVTSDGAKAVADMLRQSEHFRGRQAGRFDNDVIVGQMIEIVRS